MPPIPAPGSPAVTSVSLLVDKKRPLHRDLEPQRPNEENGVDCAEDEKRRQTRERLPRLPPSLRRNKDRNQNRRRIDHVSQERPEAAQDQCEKRKREEIGHR